MSRRPALTVSEERGVRTLHVGGEAIQSSMRLSDPFALELEYTRCMLSFLLFHPRPARALKIGLGGGSLAKFFWKRMPWMKTRVVELDRRVVDVARAQFHLPADEAVAPGDVLHWTGLAGSWNAMCAECHSTGLAKGYDASRDVYAPRWSELDVSCEACHGPGSRHVEWARRTGAGGGIRFGGGAPPHRARHRRLLRALEGRALPDTRYRAMIRNPFVAFLAPTLALASCGGGGGGGAASTAPELPSSETSHVTAAASSRSTRTPVSSMAARSSTQLGWSSAAAAGRSTRQRSAGASVAAASQARRSAVVSGGRLSAANGRSPQSHSSLATSSSEAVRASTVASWPR